MNKEENKMSENNFKNKVLQEMVADKIMEFDGSRYSLRKEFIIHGVNFMEKEKNTKTNIIDFHKKMLMSYGITDAIKIVKYTAILIQDEMESIRSPQSGINEVVKDLLQVQVIYKGMPLVLLHGMVKNDDMMLPELNKLFTAILRGLEDMHNGKNPEEGITKIMNEEKTDSRNN